MGAKAKKAYKQYEKLTEEEKAFCKEHPMAAWSFNQAADKALAEALKRYPASFHNGRGDAFRHAYWNALMVKAESYELAEEFANAHETKVGQPADEKKMDLHNNRIGRYIGLIHQRSVDSDIIAAVEEAMKRGELVWLIP